MLQENFRTFLKELAQNNQREWFHANKKRYEQEMKNPFKGLVQALITKMQTSFAPDIQILPKDAIFRINRDIRFSKDKTPYKTHASAIISKMGRKGKDYPGYYLHIDIGSLMMGGGAYFLDKTALQKVRQHIQLHPQEFRAIIEDKNFVEKYGEIKGDKNKRLPKEFKEAVKNEPLLANKQFYFMAELPPTEIHRADFVDFALDYYQTGKPLNDFLLAGIYG